MASSQLQQQAKPDVLPSRRSESPGRAGPSTEYHANAGGHATGPQVKEEAIQTEPGILLADLDDDTLIMKAQVVVKKRQIEQLWALIESQKKCIHFADVQVVQLESYAQRRGFDVEAPRRELEDELENEGFGSEGVAHDSSDGDSDHDSEDTVMTNHDA
ncbi:uncharacterized protein C8Q71DRAFT_856529 [Rhodofomes roseus]|uniref:Uncharacterized protein n=1 Tax=Rhodofomes roseus TaxID=34475 RepID=A0ABQ8KKB6_9APHY|nr:uncharacterized protein C8Q71DRAFT_856529 [Rhodofomes roseus]KAH9838592.1 hypothetical protein C8Q71DRAFT_856529 [Rhodofomes roseus]